MKATVEPHKPGDGISKLRTRRECGCSPGRSDRDRRLRDRLRDRRRQVRLVSPGKKRLVLGHESLGRVIDPGLAKGFKGDLVVGIVRRPDPMPCSNCAVGEWDMCRNGQYTERGIKEIDGYMSERWRSNLSTR